MEYRSSKHKVEPASPEWQPFRETLMDLDGQPRLCREAPDSPSPDQIARIGLQCHNPKAVPRQGVARNPATGPYIQSSSPTAPENDSSHLAPFLAARVALRPEAGCLRPMR